MKSSFTLVALLSALFASSSSSPSASAWLFNSTQIVPNNCVSFSVSAGTGCAWMCNYCSNQLGTYNYYFTDGVCTYQTGGCAGSPQAGVVYTCCSA